MSELKLYGMRASFDEIAGKGLVRRDEIYPLIASLIVSESDPHIPALGRMPMLNTLPAGRPALEPTHPGELLREEVLPALGVSVTKAAELLRISRQALHAVLGERAAVTPEMAVRLGKLCGNRPGLWLRMQQARDLWVAERDMAETVAEIPTMRAKVA